VKKLLKAKKFEIVALILMSFEQQAVSFQRNIKNFNSSGRVMYINQRTKNKKCQIIICQPPLNQCRAR